MNFVDQSFATTYTGVNGSNSTLNDTYVATSPVTAMSAGASPIGALDMAGNLAEWCYDYMSGRAYQNPISTNPTGPTTGTKRVYRGGSWADNLGNAQSQLDLGHNIRAHARAGAELKMASDQIGFRVVIGTGGAQLIVLTAKLCHSPVNGSQGTGEGTHSGGGFVSSTTPKKKRFLVAEGYSSTQGNKFRTVVWMLKHRFKHISLEITI